MRRLFTIAALFLVVARPAFAHVEVSPESAERGQATTFTFTVPNEEKPAKTNAVEVVLPDGVPSRGVSAAAPAGWTHAVVQGSVQFSGGTIADDDEAEFKVTLQVPATISSTQIVFKVVQTYDNGEVARWIDIQTGSEEPPHPAPAVKLTGTVVTTATSRLTNAPTTAAPKDDDDGDGSAAPLILLGALVVAGIGAGIAVSARRRRSA